MSILTPVTEQVRRCAVPGVLLLCLAGIGFAADQAKEKKANEAYDNNDYATALRLYTELANGGDSKAKYQLGTMYVLGLGVQVDYVQAVKWLVPVSRSFPDADEYLGDIYKNGQHGVTQDYAEATKWYLLALSVAEDNDHSEQSCCIVAKINLGWMAALGYGMPKDVVQAEKWYQLAAASDQTEMLGKDQAVQQFVKNLRQSMSPTQIAEASRLATTWIQEAQTRDVARPIAFLGKWYRAEFSDSTVEFKLEGSTLRGKEGRESFDDIVVQGRCIVYSRNLHMKGIPVQPWKACLAEEGVLILSSEKQAHYRYLRDPKLAKAARKASEDPAEAAERRAQNLALIAGVVGQVAQSRADIARTNAETQQRIEQQKAEQAARQQQQDQQQQEALNQRLAAQRAQQQAQEQAQQQQALDQRARDQQATELRLQAQAAANEAAAQQLKQQEKTQQQKAPAPTQVASNSTSPRAQTSAPTPSPQQPAPQPTPQKQPPARTQPALSDLAIEDVQLHDPNAIDGNVCYVSYTLFNHFNRTVSITVDVDVVSRGLESRARYVDGIGPNMGYTFKHQEDISCRPADADGASRGTANIRAVQ